MSTLSIESFKNFFKYYGGESHQEAAVEELYKSLQECNCDQLNEDADWVKTYRKTADIKKFKKLVTPLMMEQLTGYPSSAFDKVFIDDCNRLYADTGFAEHIDAAQMLMANMMHETCNFVYMKEISDGMYLRGRSDLGHGPDEGEIWKGAGVLQLTGKYNYSRLAEGINDPKVMDGVDYVSTTYPFTSARIWIEENDLLNICLTEGFDACCYRINGGWNGYNDRLAKYNVCKQYMV